MIHFFKILFCITLALIHFKSISQDIWTTLDFQTTNTGDNGLIGQWTMAFMQDYQGRIWIGTESGISIKDGSNWTSMTTSEGLRVDEVADLVEDIDSSIWIGYGSYITGISNYKNGKFTHFNTTNTLLNDKVESIFRDSKNNIWIATQGGLNRFDGETWYSYTAENGFANSYPTSITEDTLGNIWFGTRSDGLWFFDGNEFTNHYESGAPGGYVDAVFIDNENRIWAYSSGVYVRDNYWSKLSPPNNSFGVIRDINQDLDSTVFLCSSQGVYAINKNFEVFHYTIEHGIPHNSTLSTYLINDQIFIGTEDGYAYFNNDQWISNLTSENGLIHNDINHIFQDSNGSMWFCTQGGISKYDGTVWESYRRTPEEDEIEWVKSGLQDKNGNYWFTTVHGIFKFDGTEWEIFDYNDSQMFNSWGQEIIEDRDGNIWIASWRYVLKFDGTDWTHYNDTSGFLNNHCDAIFEDSQGRIWVGSRSQISVWDQGAWKHHFPNIIYHVGDHSISSFIEDSTGNVIASGYYGSYILKDGSWEYFEGTSSQWHFDSFIDKNNIMWFGTISGIGKYDGSAFQLFNTQDGLAGDVVKSIYRDNLSGEIWVGTTQGITHIIPDIEVTDVEVSNTFLRVASYGISKPFHYSIDGDNYENTSGEFVLQNENDFNLYITNSYDTIIHANLRSQTITDLEELKSKNSVVFPNPSSGLYKINEGGNIKVYDINGNLHCDEIISHDNFTLDLTDKPNGLFIIQIQNKNKIETYRILKN